MTPQGSQRLPGGLCERCRRSPVWPSHRGSARLRSGRLVRGHPRAFVRRVRRFLRRPDQKRPFFSGFLHVVRVLEGALAKSLCGQELRRHPSGRRSGWYLIGHPDANWGAQVGRRHDRSAGVGQQIPSVRKRLLNVGGDRGITWVIRRERRVSVWSRFARPPQGAGSPRQSGSRRSRLEGRDGAGIEKRRHPCITRERAFPEYRCSEDRHRALLVGSVSCTRQPSSCPL